jgi:hypothetical protein
MVSKELLKEIIIENKKFILDLPIIKKNNSSLQHLIIISGKICLQ